MYEVFDRFCKVPTWDTPHALDEERFRAALSEVVHLAGFSPAEMGRYIKLNHVEPIWPKTVAQHKALAGCRDSVRRSFTRKFRKAR